MLASTVNLMPDKSIIPLLGIFIVVLVVLNAFVFRPVLRMLDRRWSLTDGELERAREMERVAEEFGATVRENLDDAREQGAAVRKKFREKAEARSRTILDESKRECKDIVSTAREGRKRLGGKVAKEMESRVPEISELIASHAMLEKRGNSR